MVYIHFSYDRINNRYRYSEVVKRLPEEAPFLEDFYVPYDVDYEIAAERFRRLLGYELRGMPEDLTEIILEGVRSHYSYIVDQLSKVMYQEYNVHYNNQPLLSMAVRDALMYSYIKDYDTKYLYTVMERIHPESENLDDFVSFLLEFDEKRKNAFLNYDAEVQALKEEVKGLDIADLYEFPTIFRLFELLPPPIGVGHGYGLLSTINTHSGASVNADTSAIDLIARGEWGLLSYQE